jgi:hypothetical protein
LKRFNTSRAEEHPFTMTLDKAGQVLDLEKTLKDFGVWNVVQPTAVKPVENHL